MWVKVSNSGSEEGIFGKYETTGNQKSYRLTKTSGDVFLFGVSNDGSADVTVSSTEKGEGMWRFVACVYDGTDIKISVDGGAFATTSHATGIFDSTTDVTFGLVDGTIGLDGAIRCAFFYSVAIDSSAVTALYNSGDPLAHSELSASQLTSLVSYWEMNEGSSADRLDKITASGNDLTDGTGNDVLNEMMTKRAASFVTANSEELTITDASQSGLTPTGNHTIVGWFNVPKNGVAQGLVSKWATSNREYVITKEGDDLLYFFNSSTGSGGTSVSTSGFTSNQWFFCAAVYDGSNLKLSIDGGAFTSASYSSGVYQSGSAEFAIGSYAGAQFCDGEIGSVGFFDEALSLDEIKAIYREGIGITYSELTTAQKTDLVSWWELDELSGTRSDAHASNDLTDENTVLAADSPVVTGWFAATGANVGITKLANAANGGFATPVGTLYFVQQDSIPPIIDSSDSDFLDFDNAAGGLKNPDGSAAQTLSIIAIVNPTSSTYDFINDGYDSGDTPTSRALLYGTGGVIRMFAGSDQDTESGATGLQLLVANFAGSSSEFWLDGAEDVDSLDPSTAGIEGFTLGARFNDASPFTGKIKAVLVLERAITSDEVSTLATEVGV